MKVPVRLLTLLLPVAMLLFSCKKDNAGNTQPDATTRGGGPIAQGGSNTTGKRDTDIYVAGYTIPQMFVEAIYWKNDTANILSAQEPSTAASVAVVNNDVYFTGGYPDYSYKTFNVSYWKNGTSTLLARYGNSGGAGALATHGNDVYIGGSISTRYVYGEYAYSPKYWKNGVEVQLPEGQNGGQVFALFINGTDVYAAGSIQGPNSNDIAAYWKNGLLTKLAPENNSDISAVSAILVKGNDVYAVGYIALQAEKYVHVAALWKNGVLTRLTNATTGSGATGIAAVGNDIYISGNTQLASNTGWATYWKNGVQTDLLQSPSSANAITVNGNDVYIAGSVNGEGYACYWKNGVLHKLSTRSAATGIAVVVH